MYTIDQYKNKDTYKSSNNFFCNLLNFVQPCFACSNTKTCKYSDDARYFTDFSAGSFDPHSTFQNCNENNIFFLRDVVVPALRNMWKSAFLCLEVSWPWNYGGDRCKGGRGADFKVKCCLKT